MGVSELNTTDSARNDVEDLIDIYSDIATLVVEASYQAQKATISGDFNISILYNDSYIEINYTPITTPPGPGELAFTFQSDSFENCSPKINISDKLTILDAKVLSYSGSHWTDFLSVDNLGYNKDYEITDYGKNYPILGDPFVVQAHSIKPGINQLNITTGDSPDKFTNCSLNNSLVYTASFKASTSYTEVLHDSEGCNWEIEMYDYTILNEIIPPTYTGTSECNFTAAYHEIANDQDAYQVTVFELLQNIDFDNDFRVDINLYELGVDFSDVIEVPYLWGPTVIKMEIDG